LAIDDLDAKISLLKKAAEKANLDRLKALAAKESKEQELNEVWDTLREKHGVSTVDEVKSLLQKSKEDLDSLLQSAVEDLKRA
jgi:hypothetical protein